MNDPANTKSAAWDGTLVKIWLKRRLAAAKLDQAMADRRGYEAEIGRASCRERVFEAV